MGSFVRLCLLGMATYVFCGVRLIRAGRSRTVGDPEMTAAGATNLVPSAVEFEMTEKGRTFCPDNPNSEFRTIDGTCNNILNKGAADLPLDRLVQPPFYKPNTNGTIRTLGPSGQMLPSPRAVSRLIHTDENRNQGLNVIFMQWGQFIDHDIALSPLPTESGRVIRCCGPLNEGFSNPLPPECAPIVIPPGDQNFKGDCMEFVRSVEAEENYDIAPESKFREQLNAVTDYVDASMVYGSEETLARELRTRNGAGAFLKTLSRFTTHGPLLPETTTNCRREKPDDFCFLAGDIRVNEHPGLTAIHTIFLRLHNLIAEAVMGNSPTGTDEELIYQRARKIVGAITQSIQYGEWLPILLGESVMEQYELTTGHRSSYVPGVNPSILNEFSTAAFRMGHSLVPNFLLAGNQFLRLRDHFLRTRAVRELGIDGLAEGFVNGTAQVENTECTRFEINQAKEMDQFVVAELNSHLFEEQEKFGLDLLSLNIQRGRDHGLPTYNQVRRACGLAPVTSFGSNEFNGSLLNTTYAHVDDIDLFVGGMTERPRDGGILGRTFSCLIGTQFFRLKYGDRYFFETNQTPEGFSLAERKVLRKITMSMVLCATTRMRMTPKNAFRVASNTNSMVDCSVLRGIFNSTLTILT